MQSFDALRQFMIYLYVKATSARYLSNQWNSSISMVQPFKNKQ